MIVYGRNPVREALRGRREVRRIWATRNAARESWLGGDGGGQDLPGPGTPRPDGIGSGQVEVSITSAEEVERRSGSTAHQGVCAEVEPFNYAAAAELLAQPNPLIVALDQVQDPQNLGSICRTAECAGATGVVLPERRAAAVTAAVCKASAGAVEHLAVARVRNLVDFLGEAKSASLWCYGADAGAPILYEEADLAGGVVLVLGSEGRGLRPRVAAACDLLLRIPLRGKIPSLSVAAAAAVLIYAARPGGSAPAAR